MVLAKAWQASDSHIPVDFSNTEIAFAGKSDVDLGRAYWLFKLLHYNWLVRISPPFVHFALWARLPGTKKVSKAVV